LSPTAEASEKSEHKQRVVGGELYKLYHDQRVSLIHYLRRPPHKLPIDQAIHVAQKLLDRIVFIAFCQSRRLLPSGIIQYAWNITSGFYDVENPRWQSFKGLFKKVDKGDSKQHINAYNGELFKPNLVDTLAGRQSDQLVQRNAQLTSRTKSTSMSSVTSRAVDH
jgi:hypothetical protein